jgi:hypothetical protein
VKFTPPSEDLITKSGVFIPSACLENSKRLSKFMDSFALLVVEIGFGFVGSTSGTSYVISVEPNIKGCVGLRGFKGSSDICKSDPSKAISFYSVPKQKAFMLISFLVKVPVLSEKM